VISVGGVPAEIGIGRTFTFEVTMQNAGTTTWTKELNYRLGSDNNPWTTRNRVYLDEGVSVGPGDLVRFSLPVRAPPVEGTYLFEWGMVIEGVKWFGEKTNLVVEVVIPDVNDWPNYASTKTISFPSNLRASPRGVGGMAVANIDADPEPEYIVTAPTSNGSLNLARIQGNSAQDIASWAETSQITRITISQQEICIYHSKSGEWGNDPVQPGGDPVEGNFWVLANVDGTLRAETFEWVRPGQKCKRLDPNSGGATIAERLGRHTSWNWTPRNGELVGFIASRVARAPFIGVQGEERSNVVWLEWAFRNFEFDASANSAPARIAVFDWDGTLLWNEGKDIRLRTGANAGTNFPGASHPGVWVLNDEMGYISEDGDLVVLNSSNGNEKRRFDLPVGAQVSMIANFREGREVVVQYSNRVLEARNIDTGERLWRTTQYNGFDHSPAFVGDLDGDGFDEVAGVYSISENGVRMPEPAYPSGFNSDQVDSVSFGDINGDGLLDLVLAEQGGRNATWAVTPSTGEILWENRERPNDPIGECIRGIDPDKVVIGNFTNSPGLETLARSACGRRPWLIDSEGNTIMEWKVEDVMGPAWNYGQLDPRSDGGIDVLSALNWNGNPEKDQVLLFEERHINGDVATVDLNAQTLLPGLYLERKAIMVMAVDVAGDVREEVVVLEADKLRITRHDLRDNLHERLWLDPNYAKRKQNWNYYSTS
jgi:hypothetical protein